MSDRLRVVVVDDQDAHCHLPQIVAAPDPRGGTVTHTVILVVDDSAQIRKVVRKLLEGAGHEVIEAADGRECLQRLYETKPDLVLLDVSMPDMDGWTALERIREMTFVPVLMVTARDRPPERVRGLKGGADDYILKPFEPDELLARIDAVLRRAAATAAAPPPPPAPPPRLGDQTQGDPW